MERNIIITRDGSQTVELPEMKVTYHSVHGAIQESIHVFIQAGLIGSGIFDYTRPHHVLEVGFGTGLNALLTLIEADKNKNYIHYAAIEPYPLDGKITNQFQYCDRLNEPGYQELFEKMHQCSWEEITDISEHFRLTKWKCTLAEFTDTNSFSLVYFDAFAPAAQPELWTKEVFVKLYNLLMQGGKLVTYCSKGDVRRAMEFAGFIIEKLPGPPGKREMIRAIKR